MPIVRAEPQAVGVGDVIQPGDRVLIETVALDVQDDVVRVLIAGAAGGSVLWLRKKTFEIPPASESDERRDELVRLLRAPIQTCAIHEEAANAIAELQGFLMLCRAHPRVEDEELIGQLERLRAVRAIAERMRVFNDEDSLMDMALREYAREILEALHGAPGSPTEDARGSGDDLPHVMVGDKMVVWTGRALIVCGPGTEADLKRGAELAAERGWSEVRAVTATDPEGSGVK